MPTLEYHLYRTKFIKPSQVDLFHPNLSAREIFEAGLAERPSIALRENNVWHIGNVEYFNENGGRFAIGRTTLTTVEKFDIETGNFTELVDDSGPYTFVYFDSKLGLLGIGKKAKVAVNVKSIARKIQKLLSSTLLVKQNKVDVRVEFIRDPEDFLQKIHSAYAIKRFNATFTGPNPIDADEVFQKPMSYYCQQLGGSYGNVTVTGEFLNEESVAAVAKSTAATANDATATIQNHRGEKPVRVSFKGDAKKVFVEHIEDKTAVLQAIQNTYSEVRE
ncbi:hypothetical protein [Chromobacterium paludis]|uniref:DUF4747 family protein n=1 Tax=Chromobacterium paludis TaxID=2605945 RepID=A0A5C1DJV5_9NEIS|nr:hypothetical protein [Chromobacterium paludis]QEL56863.1 hypothetical protein FYK34_15485 [Chromobacterium paludis]